MLLWQWDWLLVRPDVLTADIALIIVVNRTVMIMNTLSSHPSSNILPILNSNRITEERQKEAIKAMGLSSCQVHCIAVTGARHYSAKH